LQPSYATFISKEPLNLSLLQSLTPEQFNQIWSGAIPQSFRPSNPQLTTPQGQERNIPGNKQ
jgi:hypothetical protein